MTWEKVLTREIPLLIVFYANKGYYYLKKIDGFSSLSGFIENKEGVIERYVESNEFLAFKKRITIIIRKGKEKEIIAKAMELDKELDTLINNFNQRHLDCEQDELLDTYLEFNQKYSIYWAYYLFIFYIGSALEGKKNTKIVGIYNREITHFRGKHSQRVMAEEIFLPQILSRISEQTKIGPALLLYLFPKEIISFLRDKSPINVNILNERKKHYQWIMEEGKEKYCFGKNTSIKEHLIFKNEHNTSNTTEIKGSSAYPGIVKGYVKCIKTINDVAKVRKGDVLVAPMTDLNYMVAMKKAAAFVTDEGGILCHAAIVAREMRKPCIIGTKLATQVLKDGDIVEVDAEKGIVRKIK